MGKKIRVEFELPENLPATRALLQAAHDVDKSIHRLCKDICLQAYGGAGVPTPPPVRGELPPSTPLAPGNSETKGMLSRAAELDDDEF